MSNAEKLLVVLLGILLVIPLILGMMWCMGWCVIHLLAVLGFNLPQTHMAYLSVGLLISLIRGGTRVVIRKE